MRISRLFFQQKTLKVAKKLLGKYLIRKHKGRLLIGKIVETEAYIGPKDKASHAYSKKEQPMKEKVKIIEENWGKIKNYVENKDIFIKRILYGNKKNKTPEYNTNKMPEYKSNTFDHHSGNTFGHHSGNKVDPHLRNFIIYYNKVTKRNLAEYLRGGHIYIYLIYGNYYQLNITTYKEGYPECVLIRSLEPILNLKNPKGPGRLCEELKLDSSFWGEDLVTSERIWIEDEKLDREPVRFLNKNKFNATQHKYIITRTTRIGIDYAEECKFLKWRFYIKGNKWVSRK
ncbi:MAG: hypothetical protein KatS3mg097_085 [Candidatus Parcubacteria bacterium]|nr:MAG: hypothetical protein KatS3mg097_085 [Candidatus Parcubacteria bacterium]